MKVKELKVVNVIKKYKPKIKPSEYEYNRFDAEDELNIYEIKVRSKYYEETFIEFDKYSYNVMYAQEFDKIFIYIVQMENTIYFFNVSKLYMSGYNFNWQTKKLNRSTEFKNEEQIEKIVGKININQSIYEVNI